MKFHGRHPLFPLGALLLVACGGTANTPAPVDSAVSDITDASTLDAPATDAPPSDVARQDAGADVARTDTAPTDRPPVDAPPVCSPRDIGSMIGVIHGDSTGTESHFEGTCGGQDAAESVLTWTAPEAGVFSFDTVGTDYDTVLYIFNGNTNCAGTELGCNDDRVEGGEDLTSIVSVRLTAGQHISIFVDGYADMSGPWSLSITRGAPDGGATDGGATDAVTPTDGGATDVVRPADAATTDAATDAVTPADARAD